MYKRCTDCGEEKLRGEFSPRGDGTQRVQARCKSCHRVFMAAYAREWRARNPEKSKNSDLLKSHGISLTQYNQVLKSQQGVCFICLIPPGAVGTGGKSRGSLAVDHDHETNDIRGLLCTNCNLGLGSFFSKPHLLRRAAEYIEGYQRIRTETNQTADELLAEMMSLPGGN